MGVSSASRDSCEYIQMTQHRREQAQRRGRWGEYLCRLALALTGWTVLQHGFSGKRGSGAGEIDLIAKRGQTLAFIEVKARPDLTSGLEAVSDSQQTRIMRGAEQFLAVHPDLADHTLRFDVMVVRPWRWPKRIPDAWRPR